MPDTARVTNALRQFKADRQQMALVIDEHGSVDGIVTLEDLLEEIVGEIWDETDANVMGARWDDDGSLTIPGTFPIHDLPDVGVNLEEGVSGDYTTIAGFVLKLLGRVPTAAGDVIDVGEWRLEIVEVGHHAVTAVRITPTSAADEVGTRESQ